MSDDRAWAFALCFLLGSSLTAGCAEKTSASDPADAGEDAAPLDLGDANTHSPPVPFDGGSGPCAIMFPLGACLAIDHSYCIESWTPGSLDSVQICQGGIVTDACPQSNIAGYCLAPPLLTFVGDVTYYYRTDPTLSTDESYCTDGQGVWCP